MQSAPDFTLPDQTGAATSLSDYRGHWIVFYFYPKDDTPGCTTEACAFRDEHEAIAALDNTVVLGISADSVSSHQRFANKYHLTFSLLSDSDRHVIKLYNAGTDEQTRRCTFLINPSGYIAKSYYDVRPEQHIRQVITDLRQLQAQATGPQPNS